MKGARASAWRSCCVLGLLLVATAGASELPDNKLSNGEFDHVAGTDGWSVIFPGISYLNYIDYEDANNCSFSGVAEAENLSSVDSGSSAFRICTTDFTEGVPYTLYARFLFHPTTVASRALAQRL